ncbi:MAG: class II aldolase/adducin family protein [Ancrocorticia sp.]|jgi:L-ribulose-5-phosphate 4-epimerase|nr:class II aldolase/adducin family protein [Ancrocorticia sp.]MCI1896572.1 class II aldolase/adducin family protein [Ancrocorticia sp.]MCI1932512.1 class II aldolase/adducin family protein [Ancrocorticia sp.]MCI2013455.1 class II aldolase/adducin family protein [Ancrocorticia sp.]MCI2030195.1 class II aldolase/adducin family protein [Ancrocorticia sp.]
MREEEARKAVVEAGVRLVKSGLIARTWGNVSCRISDTHFVITPTGRDYLTLTPEDVVPVSIADLSHTGDIKPSGERGVHAVIYATRQDVDFVIHTHQANASALGAGNVMQFRVPGGYPTLGGTVYCAAYGLPSTKRLQRNVHEALVHSTGHAIIMKQHGAVCFGRDADEAFRAAQDLEEACQKYVEHAYSQRMGGAEFSAEELRNFALRRLTQQYPAKPVGALVPPHCSSERTGTGFVLHTPDGDVPGSVAVPSQWASEAALHGAIYRENGDISCVLFADTPDVVALSRTRITMLPLLDDFAQIVGTKVRTVFSVSEAAKALRRASAVLLAGQGALCCGANAEDAEAVRMIVQKNCQSYVWSSLFGQPQPIGLVDRELMRAIYLKKYSREITQNV